MKRPFGITLISYFYIFGAIVLLLTLGVKQEIGFNIRFGVPDIPETVVRIFIIAITFIIAYGYLNLKKWGYFSMILYSILFFVISLKQAAVYNNQPFIANAIYSIIVLIYTVIKRDYFHNNEQIS